jgi:beta-glucosidase
LSAPAVAEIDATGQEIYAASLGNAHARCGRPVPVTGHGVNATDDVKRARLIPAALAGLRDVIAEGIPARGYTHWSLIDNWEWFYGYKRRYGLQRWIAKPSGARPSRVPACWAPLRAAMPCRAALPRLLQT